MFTGDTELALLAGAVAATNTSFIITDHTVADDPIIFCNAAFERLTGYGREEILGRNCRFLQRHDQEQPELEALRQALREKREVTVILRNYRKDGTPFRNELSISPVRLQEDEKVTHMIGIQRAAAPSPVKAPEEFHHEWRTPLTVIKGTLQLLQQKGMAVDPVFFEKSLLAAVRAIEKLESLGRGITGA
ncbi:PAS domain-containing protein [Mucilaginibacter pedocola]|uniref:histidine kinase n=1 Tax=Mucilaginibacter pedocola TaxID=1792845 RepID=A0A1S9P6N7_9SPHI|nr:PAS domain-containing protein [Mucilaginibacter pedocola]OOQ56609.1 hypothetical protein BC343_19460 [Mucilaginibacter pedocola]